MFSRKRDKKRKTPMTAAEMTKLEEVGIRRGLFGKKLHKKDKDDGIQKHDISRPLSVQLPHEDEKTEQSSVLQRASMYGQVKNNSKKSSSSTPVVAPKPGHDNTSNNSIKQSVESVPVAPLRRKTSTKSPQEPLHYDVPKSTATPEGYMAPRLISQRSKEALLVQSQKQAAPRASVRSSQLRTVVLKKRPGGDFGLSLRRSAEVEIVNNKEIKKTIYFAEPGQSMESSTNDDNHSRLYLYDRLLEIEGVDVENLSRDDIISKIRSAGSQVTLLVQSMKNTEHLMSEPNSQEPRYSVPRKLEVTRPGIKTVPSLPPQVKDDGTPKLPVVKKNSPKEDDKKIFVKTPITRRKSWNNNCEKTARPNGVDELFTNSESHKRSFSVCAGESNARTHRQEHASRAVEVTPSELHASSTFNEHNEATSRCIKPVKQMEDMNDTSVVRNENVISEELKGDERAPVRLLEKVGPENEAQAATENGLVQAKSCEPPMESFSSETYEKVTNEDEFVNRDRIFSPDDNPTPSCNQDVHKPIPLPDVIHVPKKSGLKWIQKEKVWYRKADGIDEAYIVVPDAASGDMEVDEVPDGKTRIEIIASKDVMMVPEDDVEIANDSRFDREPDLTKLRHLNESGMLHTLSQRYEGGLNYSLAGPYLASVRLPYQHHASSNNFTEKVRQTYKGTRFGDTPAHLYATAQHAYHDMMSSSTDQCVLGLGVTGSGKSSDVRHVLHYYTTIGAVSNSNITVDKVMAVLDVFESISSSASRQCRNSSRCVHVYNMDFDRSGQLAAMSVQALLLERTRLIKRNDGEANFNIFYQLLHGADTQLRRELFLLDVEQASNYLVSSSYNSDPNFHQMAVKGFAILQQGFECLGFSQNETKAIFMIIAACLHLGLAGSQKVDGGKYQFAKADSAQKAASLLGIPVEMLSKLIFHVASGGKRMRTSSSASLKRSNSTISTVSSLAYQTEDSRVTGQQALDSFVVGLYAEVFRSIVSLVNRALASSMRAQNTIIVVDAPGYQGSCNGSSPNPASYADLTFNYVQDRLHALYHHNAFTVFKDRYQQEGIDCDVIVPDDNFMSSVDAVDQPPTLGGSGVKGLFWILDEEAASPGASDESFVERLLLHYGKSQTANALPVVQRSPTKGVFTIRHQAGSSCVEYDASGWLAYAFYSSTVSSVSEVLQDSKKSYICELFGGFGDKTHSSVSSLKMDAGVSGLKRGPSFRKAWSSTSGAAAVKKSMCMIAKFQTDGLIDMIRRANPHFILSFSPSGEQSSQKLSVDVAHLRKQLRGFQLLDATRTLKQGYPEHVVFSEFRRRFDVLLRHLAPNETRNSTSVALLEDKEATENIINHVELSRSQYKFGVSQVFFRSGILNVLEDKRNEKVSSVLISLQAQCRGYLARKRYERKKVQVVAVRCIQRNIRKFMAIRQWPWWRLLTKVLPLVEVTRTEEELREKQADLDIITEKFIKAQSERDELKQVNAKYEAKLQDFVVTLDEERSTAAHASDLLEHERKERLRLEKLLKDTQASHNELQERVESMEVELAEKRLLYSEHIQLDSDDEEEDSGYKIRYEKAVREFNFQNKKKSQEYEDELEEMRSDKRAVERKLIQFQEELEDQQRIENQSRKKLHKLNAELSDAKIHLEETNVKNHELEKKQRKFDSELYGAHANVTELKTSRDRMQREKDRIQLEKIDLEKEIEEKADEVDSLNLKLRRLEEELEDTDKRDTDDRHMVNNLKKRIRDLEAETKDQEEELEEQASTIHTLEHAKERIEMSAEHARQQRQREVEGKEEELEEMRSSYHKKIKQLELQLEEGDEERAAMLRQKRELEHEVQTVRDRDLGHDAETEKRLRRDLKRYKALLADAQTMIDHLKADVVSKQQMKQLKAQVEDLQYTSTAAVKSRKAIELEVEDLQAQLDEVSKSKQDAESRVGALQRETHELRSKLEEDAEDTEEILRKYRSLVSQQTEDRRLLVEAQSSVEEMKHEKNMLEEKILGLQNQIEFLDANTTDLATLQRLESKVKDYETKLEFQKTTTRRLEVHLTRSKENADKLASERDSHAASGHREKEALKRMQRQLRESKEEQGDMLKREQEALQKKHDLEMELADHQNQIESLQADLKLAFKRISDLQASLEEVDESDFEDDDDDVTSSDEEITSSKFGWRSRRSTYSMRSRSIASSRNDLETSSLSDNLISSGTTPRKSSLKAISALSCRNNKAESYESTSGKNPLLHALPVEESMSRYGKEIANRSRAASGPRSRSESTSIVSGDSSGEIISQKSVSLDPVSRSLADENPSFLLYGKPNNISMNLGLGKASSFHALNETLRAVKYRQNLPESQKLQLKLRDKVNSDIEKMKMATPHNPNQFSSNEDEEFETRSAAEYSNRSYFDLDDNDEDSRPPSCIRRSNSRMSHRPHSRLSNSSRASSESRRSWDRVPDSPDLDEVGSETDLIMKRHETLQETRDKPFTSRFLQKVKQRRNPSMNGKPPLASYSYLSPRSRDESFDANESNQEEDWADTIRIKRSCRASPSNGFNNGYNAPFKNHRRQNGAPPQPVMDFEDKHSLASSDPYIDDDVSLSYYGLNQSPGSSLNGDGSFEESLPPTQPRTSRSLKKGTVRQSRNLRTGKQLFSRSLSRGDETMRPKQHKYSSDYEDIDYETTDPLDSIISKYLYRKTFSSDEEETFYSMRNGDTIHT